MHKEINNMNEICFINSVVDFAIGLVNPVLNLPGRKVKYLGGIQLTDWRNCNQFFSLVKLTLGIVHDFSLHPD